MEADVRNVPAMDNNVEVKDERRLRSCGYVLDDYCVIWCHALGLNQVAIRIYSFI